MHGIYLLIIWFSFQLLLLLLLPFFSPLVFIYTESTLYYAWQFAFTQTHTRRENEISDDGDISSMWHIIYILEFRKSPYIQSVRYRAAF